MNQSVRPPLTIAVPTYNRASSLEPLLEMLIAQATSEDELLVLDDASSDNIAEVVSAYPAFRFVRNENNLGMVGNWNACLKAARHDWVCIIHHDDYLAPTALQALRRACALADGPALVVHWREHARLGDQFRCRLCEPGPWAVLNVPTIPSGAVVHRRVVEDIGVFDPRWAYSPDLEYFPRICQRFPLVIIESPQIVRYRLHHTNYQYETWRKPDFEDQLREIQKLVVSYADLPPGAAAYQLEERMAAMYSHIFHNAIRLGDRALLRKAAKRLAAGRNNGRRMRLRAGIASILGWYPGMHGHRVTMDSFEFDDS